MANLQKNLADPVYSLTTHFGAKKEVFLTSG